MEANEYKHLAMLTNNKNSNNMLIKSATDSDINTGEMLNAALGLSGEVGEVNDMIKKHIFHGHDLDRQELRKELGDVMWYIALMCNAMEFNLDTILEQNIEKLKARYPEGFSESASQHRAECQQEHKELYDPMHVMTR